MKNNNKKQTETYKSGEQVVETKLKAANEFLRKANLDIIYKAMANK